MQLSWLPGCVLFASVLTQTQQWRLANDPQKSSGAFWEADPGPAEAFNYRRHLLEASEELWQDGSQILARRPDFFFFNYN